MYNRKELKVESTAKKLPTPKDVIVDPMGQWKYPGEITKIPSNQITMKGVPYPVLGEDNLGNQQMMYPGMDYVFPGQSVTEYPQLDEEMRYGGLKRKSKRSTSNPAVGVNDLMLRNPQYHTRKRSHFVPSKEQGGSMNNDNFYVPHEDAAKLRATTPINFINTPYYNLGGASDGPIGYFQEGGSPFNYGAFPVMVGGGEFNMIINDLLEKQFGGTGSKNPAPTTDNVIENNKNFFNSYIRNNVGKALAQEMKNEFEQQMMTGAYMQQGGPYNPSETVNQPQIEDPYSKAAIINKMARDRALNQAQFERNLGNWGSNNQHLELFNDLYKDDSIKIDNIYKSYPVRQDGGSFTNPYANSFTGITNDNENLSMQMQWGGPAMDRADVNARTVECSPIDKMDPNSPCYDPNFAEQGTNQNKQQFNFPYSTPQGSFDAQGNQTADPYGKMPGVESPYFVTQSPNFGQELVGATPQKDVGTWDMNNPNAPNTPQTQTWNMDPNQMRSQEPGKTTSNKQGQAVDWMSMMPNGMDIANQMIGTMDFISSRLEANQNKKQDKANKWRFSGDANFVAKPQTSSSRGDYDVNSGMFRPDQYVPVQFRGNNMGNVGSPYYTAQYGGSGFNDEEEVYMSDEEIQQFLASGGQLEILD